MNYVLDDNGEPVREPDHDRWKEWYVSHQRECKLAETQVHNRAIGLAYTIVTIFDGVDRNRSGQDPPLLFETLVFPTKNDRQFSTRAEALEGHARIVAELQAKEPGA